MSGEAHAGAPVAVGDDFEEAIRFAPEGQIAHILDPQCPHDIGPIEVSRQTPLGVGSRQLDHQIRGGANICGSVEKRVGYAAT